MVIVIHASHDAVEAYEGTTCVPPEQLLQADIGTSLVECGNYFRLVYYGGTENHSFR
jgi:hypothetical protein